MNKRSVLGSLRAGNVFASSGPAIRLASGGAPMGGETKARGGTLAIDLECADSYGLNWVKVVAQGKTVRRVELRGAKHLHERVSIRLPSGARYVRAECAAVDDRRAYANPVYLV